MRIKIILLQVLNKIDFEHIELRLFSWKKPRHYCYYHNHNHYHHHHHHRSCYYFNFNFIVNKR